jgi:D-alanyl-D-alanine carboxypeptidase
MQVRQSLTWGIFALLLPVFAGLTSFDSQAARYKAIVVEADSGKVLFSRNADGRHYPASLAKLMTLYLVFEAVEAGSLSFEQRVRISNRAAGQTPSRIGLKPGRTIPVEDAVLAMVTKSANDAATVLAEAISKTEVNFAKVMTETAKRLGMKNTVFRNATGLPNRRQISTARDMAVLAQALMREFPQHYHYFSTKRFTWGKRTYENHNSLLKTYSGVDGLKTGYIRAAGFNIATSAQRDGKRLIGIVLGGRTSKWRDRKMAHLLNIGFNRLQTLQVVEEREKSPPPQLFEPNNTEQELAQIGPLDAIAEMIKSFRTAMPIPKPRSSKLDLIKPKPPAPPKAKAEGTGSWGIQVGAYSTYGTAFQRIQDAVDALPNVLTSARTVVDRAFGVSRRLYRARLLGISEQSARNACRTLIIHQFVCVPIPPKDGLLTVAEN